MKEGLHLKEGITLLNVHLVNSVKQNLVDLASFLLEILK